MVTSVCHLCVCEPRDKDRQKRVVFTLLFKGVRTVSIGIGVRLSLLLGETWDLYTVPLWYKTNRIPSPKI